MGDRAQQEGEKVAGVAAKGHVSGGDGPQSSTADRIRRGKLDTFLHPRRSRIENDREIAVFLVERFGLLSLEEIVREGRARFGSDRVPSRSSIHRFWMRLRRSVAPSFRSSE